MLFYLRNIFFYWMLPNKKKWLKYQKLNVFSRLVCQRSRYTLQIKKIVPDQNCSWPKKNNSGSNPKSVVVLTFRKKRIRYLSSLMIFIWFTHWRNWGKKKTFLKNCFSRERDTSKINLKKAIPVNKLGSLYSSEH